MKKLLATAALAALIATPALADNTDTATVTVGGTVVASLTLTNAGNATMPDVVAPDAGGPDTSVVMSCNSGGVTSVTYDANGGNPFADGTTGATTVGNGTPGNSANTAVGGVSSTGTCGTINVAGENNFNYVAVYAVTVGAPTVNGGNITMSAPTCSNSAGALATGATGTLSAAGVDSLRCGATVTLAAGAAAGAYSGAAFTVAVTYD